MKLRTHFALVLLGYTFFVLSLFTAAYGIIEWRAVTVAQREGQTKSLEKVVSVCREMQLASNPIIALNYFKTVKTDPAVVSVSCLNSEGMIRADSDSKLIGTARSQAEVGEMLQSDGAGMRRRADPRGDALREWYAPVSLGTSKVGLATVSYNEEFLSQDRVLQLWASLRQPLMVACATFVLAIVIGFALAWSLSDPIGQVAKAAREIGSGNLEYQMPLSHRQAAEVVALIEEINQMAVKLKGLDELKDAFISQVSHDLRSPLAAIQMYAQFMLEDKKSAGMSAEQRRIVTLMMSNAKQLGIFINNVLDAAKIKAGRMEYHCEPTALAPVVQQIGELFSVLAAQKQISLETAVPPSLPRVVADAERLGQAITNLVSNSLKFTKASGRVVIGAQANGTAVEVYVADTGKGISKEDLERLFKPFQQAAVAEQKKEKIRGTGLGLYIVKQSAEAMGGHVSVASELGKGSRFSILLPKEGA